MTLFEAVIIAIVEGITEYLPISSTGHMIITQGILGVEPTPFTKAFTVNIQFGAILSVVVLYWKRFFQSMQFYYKLLVAFIPAAVFGLLLNDFIDEMLESVTVVAASLVLGGIVLIFIDKYLNPKEETEITYPKALKIGLFQCLAMIPGMSRSASTIIGGMTQKLTRKQAAEFSFFLAVPTMCAASAYKLLKDYESITSDNFDVLVWGNVVAFIVAMASIKFFIGFLTKFGFKWFGYYRVLVGGIILILLAMGVDLKVV